MRAPTITLDDDQEVPLDRAPTEILRAFVGGDFTGAEMGAFDNPVVAQFIASKLLKEREGVALGGGGLK